MPNTLGFQVRIHRSKVQRLLEESSADYMLIEGSYEYAGKQYGIDKWKMKAKATMMDVDNLVEESCCPMPCDETDNITESDQTTLE